MYQYLFLSSVYELYLLVYWSKLDSVRLFLL